MSIHNNESVNTSRSELKQDVNTEYKTKWIQIRIDNYTKELLKKRAKEVNKNLSQYILDFVLTKQEGPNQNNEENVNTNYYKNGCQNLILLLNEFLSQDFPNYILDKLISAIKKRDPELIQKLKEEFIDE